MYWNHLKIPAEQHRRSGSPLDYIFPLKQNMATEEARRFFKERKEAIDAASTGETLRRAFDLKNMQGNTYQTQNVYFSYIRLLNQDYHAILF